MPRHAAILIHGIGQERHYEIADQLRPAAVLSQANQTLGAVLESQENYARVALLGHSLGSVVGLDPIRELAARVNSRQLPQGDFDKLADFVTFGSPLEKTLFFFGRGAPRDEGGTSHFRDHIQGRLEDGSAPS